MKPDKRKLKKYIRKYIGTTNFHTYLNFLSDREYFTMMHCYYWDIEDRISKNNIIEKNYKKYKRRIFFR